MKPVTREPVQLNWDDLHGIKSQQGPWYKANIKHMAWVTWPPTVQAEVDGVARARGVLSLSLSLFRCTKALQKVSARLCGPLIVLPDHSASTARHRSDRSADRRPSALRLPNVRKQKEKTTIKNQINNLIRSIIDRWW